MVVNQINVRGVPIVEPEDDSPVSRDCYCPETGSVAAKAVQPVAREIYTLCISCGVQPGQNVCDLVDVIRRDAPPVSVLI